MFRHISLGSIVVAAAIACPALAQNSLPDPITTPGALNPAVTQETLASTICRSGYTGPIRPPQNITTAVKRRQLDTAGLTERPLGDYEEDHLIPLELGGAAFDDRNLWPQPRQPADGWAASRKDELEGVLHAAVCSGQISLEDAQNTIARDWHEAWQKFVGDRPRRVARPHPTPGMPTSTYYASVDGTMVHSPTTAAADFGKVMAICEDGSRSFSHHRQGTCSHHGGVATWQ